jgi:uncharacterized protein (DUF433 family)
MKERETQQSYKEWIAANRINPEINPVIRDTNMPISFVLEQLTRFGNIDNFLVNNPDITRIEAQACIYFYEARRRYMGLRH